MNALDDQFTTHDIATATRENFQQSFSFESYSSHPAFNTENAVTTTTFSNSSARETSQNSFERPEKQTETNSWNSGITEHVSPKPSSPFLILSFENSNPLPANPKQLYGTLDSSVKPKDKFISQVSQVPFVSMGSRENQINAPKASQGNKRTYSMTRTNSNSQDHVMAERKRREKLSQRFIALSSIVPGLKKVSSIFYLSELSGFYQASDVTFLFARESICFHGFTITSLLRTVTKKCLLFI